MKADLHIHSRCSDGSFTVEEIVEQAVTAGLQLVSITDHDTVEGCARLEAAGKKGGILTISGVEISAYDHDYNKKIHILGYGFRPETGHVRALGEPMLLARHNNTLRQIRAVAAAGYELTEDEVRREAGESRYLYKQHIMGVLIGKGYVDRIYSPLYRQIFKGNGPAAGDIDYVSCEDAVTAIAADGGIPVLAHPGQQQSLYLVPKLVDCGLAGIELNHPDHTPEIRERIRKTAAQYNLLLTGGSDFHGRYGGVKPIGSETAPDAELILQHAGKD
jgi:phosphoribosyl 1,2-cyclic phosphate 1,2-diphosphodiesterase